MSLLLRRLTFDVGHNEHLRLRKSLLEVVEVDGAVEGDEAHLRPGVSGKPAADRRTCYKKINVFVYFAGGWKWSV